MTSAVLEKMDFMDVPPITLALSLEMHNLAILDKSIFLEYLSDRERRGKPLAARDPSTAAVRFASRRRGAGPPENG
jgi:predicted nucleic acid-binding protein